MESFNDPILTLDIDWASDDVLELIVEMLDSRSVKATWFATHASNAVDAMLGNGLFEIGIHPNCLEGSTQGGNEDEVLGNLKSLFPEATSMRTHGLYQSSPFLYKANTEHGIAVDVSLFLKGQSHLRPFRYRYDAQDMIRIPYFWGDDAEMFEEDSAWDLNEGKYNVQGVKIFDFHPVHVVLNTTRMEDYYAARAATPISRWTRKFIMQRQKAGNGPLSLFEQIVDRLAGGGHSISDLTKSIGNDL